MSNFKNITLEISLKPFYETTPAYIESVCRRAFDLWQPLLKETDGVSILLWSSDGSEILEYTGNLDDSFEWAKYLGNANLNTDKKPETDVGDFTSITLYRENAPEMTYGILKNVVETFKKVGTQITGKPVKVGTIFDPGPEFAKSDFKYNRHREILFGNTMGDKSFVCCYSTLNADNHAYAAFKNGIPEGLPFGTFFGRQAQCFLSDLGFDYIWFSNGFGFGSEGWGTTGATFNGEKFMPENMEPSVERLLNFWKLFRKECNYPIETRGTNLMVGIDLARDAVNLKEIYDGGFDLVPPPNSPWAALDGDFGLEIAGYMSRISEVPEDDFLFRYYISDPWWMNVPWRDRYEGQPHDLYLPLSASRIDKNGNIRMPGRLNLISIDTSSGEIPDYLPSEVTPHLLNAMNNAPDAAAPFVWVYPFAEYNKLSAGRAEKPFFEDWFIRGAINNGFPLSTVVSTDIFADTIANNPSLYNGSVLVSPVPEDGTRWETAIKTHILNGGKVLLYGSVADTSKEFLELIGVERKEPLTGELSLTLYTDTDIAENGIYSDRVLVDGMISDGGIDTILSPSIASDSEVLAKVTDGTDERIIAISRTFPDWNNGGLIWLRGINCSRFVKGSYLLKPDNPEEYYPIEMLMRTAVSRFGWEIRFHKYDITAKSPVVMIHRHDNGMYFSGYMPDTTVSMQLKTPFGAPLLLGGETVYENGYTYYNMPRAWRKECRIFVEQSQKSVVSSRVMPAVSHKAERRVKVSGLVDAMVYILPRKNYETKTRTQLDHCFPYDKTRDVEQQLIDTPFGAVIKLTNVTGVLTVSDLY